MTYIKQNIEILKKKKKKYKHMQHCMYLRKHGFKLVCNTLHKIHNDTYQC